MSVKEKIITLLEVMPEKDAEILFRYIISKYQLSPIIDWSTLEEEEPDKIDLELLEDIKNNADCSEFITSDELKSELGLM